MRKLAGHDAKTSNEPFGTVIADFYFTNPIARASAVMAECSAVAAGRVVPAAAE